MIFSEYARVTSSHSISVARIADPQRWHSDPPRRRILIALNIDLVVREASAFFYLR
jgi:hypothetical protein